MTINPKHRVAAYVDRRLDEVSRRQDLRTEELRASVDSQLGEIRVSLRTTSDRLEMEFGEIRAAVRATADRVEAWGEELAKLGHLGHERANEAHQLADSVLGRVEAWGEELAKLGHLGHEQANRAVDEANAARLALAGLQQQVATFTQRIGGRLFHLEERLARQEALRSELA